MDDDAPAQNNESEGAFRALRKSECKVEDLRTYILCSCISRILTGPTTTCEYSRKGDLYRFFLSDCLISFPR